MTDPNRSPVFGRIADLLLEIGGLLLLVMMLHVTLDVAMKYLANHPVPGTLEIVSYYYMVGAVFLPIAFVELTRGSVAVDLFYDRMPLGMQIGCMVVVLGICVTVYAGLAWITLGDALRSFNKGEVVMGPVTVVVWPSRFVLPLSFGLGALICTWHLARLFLNPAARRDLIGHHSDGGEV